MRLGHRIAAIIGTLFFVTSAYAAPGDYRMVSGTLLWPEVLLTERLAVVKGDDGITYFAELGSPEGLPHVKAGDRVVVVGREGIAPGQVTSASVTAVPVGYPSGSQNYPSASPSTATAPSRGAAPAIVTLGPSIHAIVGRVELVNGNTLTVAANGQWVSVDVSRIDPDVKASLVRGEAVRVLAEEQNGRLVAQGVIIEHRVATAGVQD